MLIPFILVYVLAFLNIGAASCMNVLKGQFFPSLILAGISIYFSFFLKTLSLSKKKKCGWCENRTGSLGTYLGNSMGRDQAANPSEKGSVMQPRARDCFLSSLNCQV